MVWLEQSLCLMTDQMLLLEPSPGPTPGWKQMTGNNSGFPEPLLPRLAAPPRSEAQLLRPQDNRQAVGSACEERESHHDSDKGPTHRVKDFCLICVAEISSATATWGYEQTGVR